jgi:hypothetical protein
MRKTLFTIGSAVALAVIIGGCGDNDNPVGPQTGTLTLSFSGIEDLGSGFAYVIVGGDPVSTGTFTVDGSGNMSRSTFELDVSDLGAAGKFVLTIEPSPDNDPSPAHTHYLAGDFSGNTANLTVADGAALGDNFGQAVGSYILNTPSTASDDTDYSSGIWWLDPMAGPGPSLELPTLPEGWVYEGWVVGQSGPVTTGRFTMVSGDDSDMGGPAAGPDGVPPFPGQDYIDPMMDLIGYAAVISIEPEPDNDAGPFALKPLVDMNVEDVGIGVLQGMTNDAASFPTGTASR